MLIIPAISFAQQMCEVGFEFTCDDSKDNDGDGLEDCEDPDCNSGAAGSIGQVFGTINEYSSGTPQNGQVWNIIALVENLSSCDVSINGGNLPCNFDRIIKIAGRDIFMCDYFAGGNGLSSDIDFTCIDNSGVTVTDSRFIVLRPNTDVIFHEDAP